MVQEHIESKKPKQGYGKSKTESKANLWYKQRKILTWDILVISLTLLIVVFITRNSIIGGSATGVIPSGNTISQPLGAVWFSNPMQKISKTQASVNEGAKISAARNEYESFQIVISPKNMLFLSPQTYNVTISNFNGPGTISSSNVKIYREEYVDTGWNIDWNTHTRIYTGKKLMPDPLVKISSDQWSSLLKTDNQPIWFTVYVPEGTPAGTYFAKVEITLNSGVKFTKVVQLDVYDFSLPDEFAMRSLFGLNDPRYHFFEEEGEEYNNTEYMTKSNEVIRKYYDEFKKNRLNPFLYEGAFYPLRINKEIICPAHYGTWYGVFYAKLYPFYWEDTWFICPPQYELFDPSANEYLVEEYFNSFVFTRPVNKFLGSLWPFPNEENMKAMWKKHISPLQSHFNELGITDKAFIYLWDEACPAVKEGVTIFAHWSKEFAPNIPILISIPGKCEGFNTLDLLNQMFAINDEEKLIDIWVLNMKLVNPETLPLIEERQAMGEQIWLYSQTDGLTTITHFQEGIKGNEGIANRLLPWYAWKYDVGGLLYYYVNELCSNRWKYPSDVCPGVDIYQGSGAFFYPACKNEDDTVNCKTEDNMELVPTIRWELLREGMEDYEYFKLLHDKKIREGEVLLTNTMHLLGDYYYQFDNSAKKYYTYRNAIAEMIENN